jgi:RNA polymerase sigma-70 factor, ECF subfamily
MAYHASTGERVSATEDRMRVLMLGGLAGDAAAHRMLLSDLAKLLRPFFVSRLGAGISHAEDLVQETLISVHTKRASYDPAQPVLPWVYAIARYRMIDHFRRAKRRMTAPLEDADEVFVLPEADSADARRDLARLMESLPERQRALLAHVKIEGLSTAEAASRSGLSESAVKVTVHRAMKRLMQIAGLEGRDADR